MSQRDLMKRYDIKPDRRLGQNFLVNPDSLRKIVAAAELSPGQTVLEIGAGLGALTVLLAEQARRVITIEVDERVIQPLMEQIEPFSNVELVQGDALAIDLAALLGEEPYTVVANIPYYITSALIRKLLEHSNPAMRLILTIQKEVADRIIARDGKMSLLSLGVQLYGAPSLAGRIPAAHFYPAPKVESAILRIDVHSDTGLSPEETLAVFDTARAGFSQKRKQLKNSIAAGLGLSSDQAVSLLKEAHISPDRRPETVQVEEWKKLGLIWKQYQRAAA
ncbi:MAG: ribosomal RNA small subunit methyltransferase A [Anaerolineales bacterium]|nr:ribosomal RNA small subunit methyltransferase A [Anaerolineales bacterium]